MVFIFETKEIGKDSTGLFKSQEDFGIKELADKEMHTEVGWWHHIVRP
jgi:hypothetical protein